MNKIRRKVFLLSAGAAMDWDKGPSTEKITQEILKIGFKNKNGDLITQNIFDKLNNGKEPDYKKVNFETIVNVIEDFIEYWSKEEVDQPNLLSFFIDEKHNDWNEYIGTFQVLDRKPSYDLIIDGESESILSKMKFIPKVKKPEAIFFITLLMQIFDSIVSIIDIYSHNYRKNSGIKSNKNQNINKALKKFLIKNRNNISRIYSTNYDKIIETTFEDLNFDYTDGFQELPGELPKHDRNFVPHGIYLPKNENRNSIYHLHGSAYWHVLTEDPNGLDYYNFISSDCHGLSFNNGIPSYALEKGKSIPIFNIITGYKKVLRTGLSPFRQFFSAFDRDCYKADELIIVGYSFGDEHINDIINKARNSNSELKIEIVDPEFCFEEFSGSNIPKWGHINYKLKHVQLDAKTTLYEQLGLTVFKMKFLEYLQIKGK